MRTNTKARPVERPCSIDTFMHALGHQSAPALRPIPHTLRSHIGARQFGDFGTVLMAARPASTDLSRHVERWRGEDLPLCPHPHQVAEDRRFNFLFVLTPMMIMLMVLTGLISAWIKGAV